MGNKMDSRITIGILNHDESIFKKYIANSLKNLKGEFETIIIKNSKPAEAYNEIIRQSKNKYIVFLHADITFCPEFIININSSIKLKPDFGALCIVGVRKTIFGKVIFSTSKQNKLMNIVTSDSCCLVINKEHNLKFDSELFDEYHMYVEDYCTQVRLSLKLNIYTMLTNWVWIQDRTDFFNNNPNAINWFIHHSYTFAERGAKWGKWQYYKNILEDKWKQKIITT